MEDGARGLVVLLHSEVSCPANVASGKATTIRSLAECIVEQFGRPELLRLGTRNRRLGTLACWWRTHSAFAKRSGSQARSPGGETRAKAPVAERIARFTPERAWYRDRAARPAERSRRGSWGS